MLKIILTISFIASAVLLQAAGFPLCLYEVNEAKYIKTVKKAGFNWIQTYTQNPEKIKDLALEAQKRGVKIVVYPDKIINSPYLEEARSWPILALYLYDEPDVNKKDNSYLKNLQNAANKAFPDKKTAFVVGKGSHAKPYYDTADILMVDWYPVPHLPLTSFGEQVKDVKNILEEGGLPEKPVWGVVQSFDWREFKQYRPDDKRIGRFPTVEEMRFMAYDGLLEGAEGLFFFTFNSQSIPLPQSKPEHWKRLKKVAKEINKMLPVFKKGLQTASPLEGENNLKTQRRLYKGYYYDIILNISDGDLLLPKEFEKKKYKNLFGKNNRVVPPYTAAVLKSEAN